MNISCNVAASISFTYIKVNWSQVLIYLLRKAKLYSKDCHSANVNTTILNNSTIINTNFHVTAVVRQGKSM